MKEMRVFVLKHSFIRILVMRKRFRVVCLKRERCLKQ